MGSDPCSTCQRSNASLEPLADPSEIREVGLGSLEASAVACMICAFVQHVLSLDHTTPRDTDESYETSRIRVEDGGIRFTGQWQGALVIEIHTGKNPNLPISKEVSRELPCDNAAEVIAEWMAECESHVECTSPNRFSEIGYTTTTTGQIAIQDRDQRKCQSSYPRRLVWLGPNIGTARLVPFPSDLVQYAALSYCWGRSRDGEHVFRTDKSTKSGFEESIPLEYLPRTLNDAFHLTKRLGLDYIWVDALCIIQGDQEEWEQESAKMGLIYSNSKIVLSSTQSSNVNDGIFMPRSTTSLSQDIPYPDNSMFARRNMSHEIITSCRTKSNKWWEANINSNFPVLSRGWCFQERMLATRIVHFTPTELVWECQKCRKCECGIVQSHLYPAKNNISSAFRICLEQDVGERGLRQMWREIVRSYSVRKLTNMSDKLTALSGIAALMKKKTRDVYAAGLWKTSLPFDLLWRCDQTGGLKTKKERLPSWSWISVDGAVKWPVSQEPEPVQPLQYMISSTYFEYGALGTEVHGVECEAAGLNEFGQVLAGKIFLRTRLVEATIQRRLRHDWENIYETQWVVKVAYSDLRPFWPDINLSDQAGNDEDWKPTDTVFLMEIMKPGEPFWTWEEALVVRRVNKTTEEFERIGVAANVQPMARSQWVTCETWFSEVDLHDVVLV